MHDVADAQDTPWRVPFVASTAFALDITDHPEANAALRTTLAAASVRNAVASAVASARR